MKPKVFFLHNVIRDYRIPWFTQMDKKLNLTLILTRESKERIEQSKLADKQADRDLDKYKVDQDNATKLAIAEINAFEKGLDRDVNDNGIRDDIDIAKLKEQVRMNERKANIEERKLDQKERDMIQKSIDKDKDRQAKAQTTSK